MPARRATPGVRVRWGAFAVLALLALCAAVCAAPAAAEVRQGITMDPVDPVEPPLSGIPDNPDLASGHVGYDSSGSFSVTVRFHHALQSVDASRNYMFMVYGSIGELENVGTDLQGAPRYACNPEVFAWFYVRAPVPGYQRSFSVAGYQGSLPLTVTVSPDGYTATATGSTPVIANRDFRCYRVSLEANRVASIENIYSSYDPGCDCWAVYHPLDDLGKFASPGGLGVNLWFDGFAPPAPPPPAPVKAPKMSEKIALKYGLGRLFEHVPQWRASRNREKDCEWEVDSTRRKCFFDFDRGGFSWRAKVILTMTEPSAGAAVVAYRLKLEKIKKGCHRLRPCTKRVGIWTGSVPYTG